MNSSQYTNSSFEVTPMGYEYINNLSFILKREIVPPHLQVMKYLTDQKRGVFYSELAEKKFPELNESLDWLKNRRAIKEPNGG